MTQIIDGKRISTEIKDELKAYAAQLKEQGKEVTLAVIQVGQDPASSIYVRNKKLACEYIGIHSLSYEMEESISEEELLELIGKLNGDDSVSGILVQLPLPNHICEKKILNAIDSKKDVDCFHPQNVDKMILGDSGFLPCTPAGIIELLKRSNIEIAGKECVVVGRSNIVGKPVSILMLQENATVTIAHSRTKDLREVTKRADILIVAVGKPRMIDDSYIKEGAVIIDVGIHRGEDRKMCGDVDYDKVFDKCSAITPVPGGVGPMTIAMLMKNCLSTAEGK